MGLASAGFSLRYASGMQRQELESAIHNNYQVAQSYYLQKRQNLNSLFTRDMNNITDSIIEYINKRANEYTEAVSKKVYDYLDKIEGGRFIVGTKGQQAIQDESINLSIRNVLIALNNGNGKTNQNVGSALGNEFENFLERSLMPQEFEKQLGSVVQSAYVDVLSSFSKTGGAASKSFSVKDVKDIRPDIGLQMRMYQDEDKILRLSDSYDKNGNNLSVELQEAFDLNEFLPDNIDQITSSDILKAYLDSNAYGFSLKVWESANGKEFSKSSTIQNLVDKSFLTKRANRRTTWESTYANTYAVFQLSRLLINIISPLNVAIITGKGFTWINDFLNTRIFFMYIQMEKGKNETEFGKSKRGPGYEIFPSTLNSSIMIRELNNSIHAFNARHSKKTGRITTIRRKII